MPLFDRQPKEVRRLLDELRRMDRAAGAFADSVTRLARLTEPALAADSRSKAHLEHACDTIEQCVAKLSEAARTSRQALRMGGAR